MSDSLQSRSDFVFFFDVKDGNPNGDPDQDNLPRVDAENQQGLVTDVCMKRKIRNYVQLKHELTPPYDIFIRQGSILNSIIDEVKGDNLKDRQRSLCQNYFDIRAFGAVLSTGKNPAGTVRGPIQLTFARSEDRIYQAEHSITRCAVATKEEAEKQEKRESASTFGRKATVPYALYRQHGFISVVDALKTGFSEDDLELFWEALLNAFEHDRSAARGEMNPRRLVVFRHQSHLGNARSGQLFELIEVKKKLPVDQAPRSYADYEINLDRKVPAGVEIMEKL